MDDDFEVKMSPLCREYAAHGHLFSIEIYEGDTGRWIVEIVDPDNTSHIGDEEFDDDEVALRQAISDIEAGEIEGFGRESEKVIDLGAAIRKAIYDNGAA